MYEQGDVLRLIEDIHPMQWQEVDASHGSVESTIEKTVNQSREVFTALDGDQLLAMWGIVTPTWLSYVASPWMLSTKYIVNYPRPLLIGSKRMVKAWSEQYSVLQNYIDSRYTESVNWARHSGFTIYPPIPYGRLQVPFHRIEVINGETHGRFNISDS